MVLTSGRSHSSIGHRRRPRQRSHGRHTDQQKPRLADRRRYHRDCHGTGSATSQPMNLKEQEPGAIREALKTDRLKPLIRASRLRTLLY